MGITNLISDLGSALYELPKSATSYLSIESLLGKNAGECGSAGLEDGKTYFNGFVRNANGDLKNLDDSQIKSYATDGFFETMEDPEASNGYNRIETIVQLRDYLTDCGVNLNDMEHQISEKTNKAIAYATEFASDHGREIPFTGNPALDMLIILGSAVGLGVARQYGFYKISNKLFFK